MSSRRLGITLSLSLVGCPLPDPPANDTTGSEGEVDTDTGNAEISSDTDTGNTDVSTDTDEPPDPCACVDCPLHVDDDGPADGDGSSWATAFPTLQQAIDCSSPEQAIWIAEGDYVGEDGLSVAAVPHALELYGGFAGTEESLEQRELGLHETVLGPAQASVIVTVPGLVLDGVTVRGGQANAGAGLFVGPPDVFSEGQVTVRHARFEDNYAAEKGGAIGQLYSSTVRVEDCVFVGNGATQGASAIWSYDATIFVSNSRFEGNGGGSVLGNTTYDTYSSFHITDSEFIGNSGRAITGGRVEVDRCRFEGNMGGGMAITDWAHVYDSVFIDNSATMGGALSSAGGMLTSAQVRGSLFIGNHASMLGGALFVAAETGLEVDQSRFIGNQSGGDGGAIYGAGAGLLIDDSELRDNVADGEGGGVFGEAHVRRSTFTGNLAGGQPNAITDYHYWYDPVVEGSVLWPDGLRLVADGNIVEGGTIGVSHSCVPNGLDPTIVYFGDGVIELAGSPFDPADMDDDGQDELYLDPGSACVDLVPELDPFWIDDFDWQSMTTDPSQCTDVAPLDAGMHYEPLLDVGACSP
jgi:predicted outer membrane repeat protein